MTGEFRDKPQPGDWTFPPDMVEGMDPLAMAVLSEHEFEGAPIPYSFQVVREISENLGKAQAGDVEAARVVRKVLNEAEERYPDALGWDRLRSHLVNTLFENGHQEEAFDTVWDVSSPHQLLRLAFDLLEEIGDEALTHQIKERIYAQPDERRLALLRAMRDRIISHNDGEDQVTIFNDALMREGAETDPLTGWAESQGADYPDFDWEAIVETVRDDKLWGNLSTYQRQWATMVLVMFTEGLVGDEELDNEMADNLIQWLNLQRWDHPDVLFWDAMSLAGATKLAQEGLVPASQKVAAFIKDDDYKTGVSLEYYKLHLDDEAIDLVMTMRDQHRAAELLLDTEWQDDGKGIKKIEDVITSEDYPTEQRIAFLEFIRDRMIDAGLLARATEYQDQIDNLRDDSA